MVVSSCSLTRISPSLSHKLNLSHSNDLPRNTATSSSNTVFCAMETTSSGGSSNLSRVSLPLPEKTAIVGYLALTASLQQTSSLSAQEIPEKYRVFVDYTDGYTYIYPSDWKEFDISAHDSAFKDVLLQLQKVRVRFIPTEKKDIRDLGPVEEVIPNLVKHRFAAPNQRPTIYDMQKRKVDGKHYYTVEYVLASQNYYSASFATIAIGNGRYYTLIVGAVKGDGKEYEISLKW